MSIDMRRFHQTFFEESFDGLDIMETELLKLDIGATDIDVINTIFRAAHSIKGGSGTFGFNNVAEFTHVAETLLDEMRDGARPVTQNAVDILLRSVDIIRVMLTALRDEGEMDVAQVAVVKAELNALLGGEEEPEACTATTANEQNNTASAGWKIKFKPYIEMLRTGNDPVRMLHALAELVFHCEGPVDVFIAKHFAAQRQARLKNVLLGNLAHCPFLHQSGAIVASKGLADFDQFAKCA